MKRLILLLLLSPFALADEMTLHCVMSKFIEQHTNGRSRSFDRESDSWFFSGFYEPVLKIKPDEKTISIDMGLNLVPNSELKNHTYSENGNQLAFTDTVETTAGLYKSMYTLNKITGRFEKFQEKFTHSTSYANDKEAKWTLEKTSIDYYNCTKKEALF